jgi:hypothetical protein
MIGDLFGNRGKCRSLPLCRLPGPRRARPGRGCLAAARVGVLYMLAVVMITRGLQLALGQPR